MRSCSLAPDVTPTASPLQAQVRHALRPLHLCSGNNQIFEILFESLPYPAEQLMSVTAAPPAPSGDRLYRNCVLAMRKVLPSWA